MISSAVTSATRLSCSSFSASLVSLSQTNHRPRLDLTRNLTRKYDETRESAYWNCPPSFTARLKGLALEILAPLKQFCHDRDTWGGGFPIEGMVILFTNENTRRKVFRYIEIKASGLISNQVPRTRYKPSLFLSSKAHTNSDNLLIANLGSCFRSGSQS